MDGSKKHLLAVDAWIREAEEASKLMEDIQLKVNALTFNYNDNVGGGGGGRAGERIWEAARVKLLELGVKLDHLESLLRNPPCKPVLTDQDLQFRWTMLLDIQQKFRKAARYLYASASPSSNRPGSLAAASCQGIGSFITVHDQDNMESNHSRGDPEILTQLLSDGTKRIDEKQPHTSLWVIKKCLWNICWAFGMVLGVALLLLVLLVIVAALQSLQTP